MRAPPGAAMPVSPGSRVGPYEVLGPIGAGGMGEVYRARDVRIGRDVAIKVLPADAGADPERVRRFEQEARAAGVLNHPNILTVHDVGSADGRPFLVCELLEGETVRASAGRGPVAPARVASIGAQVAAGLAAAHAKGVVHRDLKPENLFILRDGRVKILDFGIAKLLESGSVSLDGLATKSGTAAGVIVGTAAYMSPEQVAGQPIDHRSDIFSLGVVLHELLSGTPPFTRRTTVETMMAVLREDPPALPLEAGVPPALERIVTRCLAKEADERFQSARDLTFALETAALAPTGTAPTLRNPERRRRASGPFIAGTLLGLAALGAAVAAWRLREPRSAGLPYFDRVVTLAGTDAAETSPVLSPDGKWVAYLSNEGGRTHVWVRFLSGGQPVNLTAASPDLFVSPVRDIGGLDISPDGSGIVFQAGVDLRAPASRQHAYVVAAPLGGTPRKLLDRGLGVRWSPDGRRLAYVLPGGLSGDAIAVSDASGDHARVILPVSGGVHAHWPAWSSDGRFIYYQRSPSTTNNEPSEIRRVPADGGPDERVVSSSRRALFPFPFRGGLLYSANPASLDLALWWKPGDGEPVRMTSGIGEYAEARLSGDGRRMVATAYLVHRSLWTLDVKADKPTAVALTSSSSGDIDPDWSTAVARFAFRSSRTGDQNIWTARADGSDPRQVTSGQELDESPRWSPDASRIAFVSSRGGERGIWTVAPDGGTPRRVTAADVLNTLTWSPDGREIVYAAPAGDAPGLFRVSAQGGAPTRIPTPAGASSPDWSPVTNLIAYVASRRATGEAGGSAWPALVRPTGEPVPRPEEPRLNNGDVAWSPDGKWIASLARPGGAPAALWLFPADGRSPPRQLVEFPDETRPHGLTWSGDGRRLVLGLQQRTADIVLFEASQ